MTDLQPFKQLVHDYSGLVLEGSVAEQRLQQALLQACQLLELDNPAYLARLRSSQAELDALVSQLTVNETYFFREPEQISLFVRQLLPPLLETAGPRPLRILSAGCSSGEEPYSLAMAIMEAHGASTLQRIRIDAGDVDLDILARARRALYSPFSFRSVSDALRQRYFIDTPEGWLLSEERIRNAVHFFMLNLKADHYPVRDGLYDVIFFRNVSIYFDRETRKAIQLKFREIMQPDALLFLGGSETLGNDFGVFRLTEQQQLYHFRNGPAPLPEPPQPLRNRSAVRPASRPLTVRPPAATGTDRRQPAARTAAHPDGLEELRQLLLEERYAEAQARLNLLQASGQDSTAVRLMQAWTALNLRDFTRADLLLDELLDSDSWDLDALLARGLSMKWQKQGEAASQIFRKACYAHSGCWLPQFLYGDSLRQTGQLQAAQAPLDIARRILSDDLQAGSGCRWLPLGPPAGDALFLTERHLQHIRHSLLQQPTADG